MTVVRWAGSGVGGALKVVLWLMVLVCRRRRLARTSSGCGDGQLVSTQRQRQSYD